MNYQNFKIIIIILLNLISKLKENKQVYDDEKRNNEDLKNKNFSRNNLNQMKYRKKLKNYKYSDLFLIFTFKNFFKNFSLHKFKMLYLN